MNRETSSERRIVRRCTNHDFVIAWREVPAGRRVVEGLQDSRINRHCDCLRFTWHECHSLPSHQPFERFVCAFRKSCVHFRDLSACPFPGILHREADSLRGGIDG